jgi:uncharacterized membrane protein
MVAAFERLVRHALYALRDRFLVRPLVIALGLGALGILLPLVEERFPSVDAWAEGLPVLAPRDPTAASGLLASIISAMMTVVSIVLSVLLVALTFASVQFSPRVLTGFVEDRVTQRTIGVFLGAFLFCLFAYPMARAEPPTTPAAAALVAMVIALMCILSLLTFVHHIARSINVNNVTERVALDTERVIDEVARPPEETQAHEVPPLPCFDDGAVIRAARSGYIRFIDRKRLRALAKSADMAISVERRVGDFIPQGVPLVRLSRAEPPTSVELQTILAAVDLGSLRTMEQDIEFGLLQLVDIALKAVSPAVNDPSTAINCVDQLSRLLIRFVAHNRATGVVCDPPGVVRVVFPVSGFDRMLDIAFDQIIHYGKSDAAVSLRVQHALADVAAAIDDPAARALVLALARRAAAAATGSLPGDEADLVTVRFGAVERIASPSNGSPIVAPQDGAAYGSSARAH